MKFEMEGLAFVIAAEGGDVLCSPVFDNEEEAREWSLGNAYRAVTYAGATVRLLTVHLREGKEIATRQRTIPPIREDAPPRPPSAGHNAEGTG
jgi:hypothetical protein